MGKSRETYSKKENEKKKQRKKQDKEQKKEDRKAHSGKGKTVEEMFAYVDDDGNITSTPPDPKRKRTIREEDITIGIPRQADIDPADLIRKGSVTFFNESKGYGFIKDQQTQQSIFVHANGLLNPIKENDQVTFQIEIREKGPSAVGVKLVGK